MINKERIWWKTICELFYRSWWWRSTCKCYSNINDSYIENGRVITETVYEQPDGTIITDTLDVSAIAPFSKNGTDTATRTRTIAQWGSITIKASFKWYTSYTKDYLSIGKAKAQVKYYFYNPVIPVQYQDGTFKITCTDSGTISDNN